MKIIGFLIATAASFITGWQVTQFLANLPGINLGMASSLGGILAWFLVFTAAVLIFRD